MGYELAGLSEVGEILGVSRQRAAQLADSSGFPGPVPDLASGRIWRVQDVQLWSETRRRGGRPRTGYRIEFVGDRDEKRKGRRTVSLAVIWIDQPGTDRIFERWMDRNISYEAGAQPPEHHRRGTPDTIRACTRWVWVSCLFRLGYGGQMVGAPGADPDADG